MGEKHREFLKEYENEMKKFVLPPELQAHWKAEKCLKDGKDNWTLLVKEEASGIICVLKWAEGLASEMLLQEFEILKELKQNKILGIPQAYRLMKTENGVYFLREYINGVSVFEKVEETGRISEKEIIEVGSTLCQMVEQFQKLENPFIHRDIKPENVIITPEGKTALIDFGTGRYYRMEKQGSDTFVAGSRGTAAPEQFGFSQTNERTDVYSIGRTLLYMAAGSYDEKELFDAKVSRRLKKVIRKASAFDPEKRYKHAKSLENALSWKKDRRKILGGAAVAAVCVCAGIFLHRSIFPIRQPRIAQEEKVMFREPLIERAVRVELGLSEEETIVPEMLEKVSSLRIMGTEILTEEEQFGWVGAQIIDKDWEFGREKGSIVSLSDLSALPNLTDLEICNQKIRDITPLRNLPIQKLYLSDNLITDLEVLHEMPDLEELCIQGNPADNLDVLGECMKLRHLRISDMAVKDIEFLRKLKLFELGMEHLIVKEGDLSPLKTQHTLGTLYISDVGEDEAEIIRGLYNLENLSLGRNQEIQDLKYLGGMKNLIFLSVAPSVTSLEGIEEFPVLQKLNLFESKITDISKLIEVKNLKEIDLRGTIVEDLTPLFEMKSLETVVCDEKNKARILEINSSPDFELL